MGGRDGGGRESGSRGGEGWLFCSRDPCLGVHRPRQEEAGWEDGGGWQTPHTFCWGDDMRGEVGVNREASAAPKEASGCFLQNSLIYAS